MICDIISEVRGAKTNKNVSLKTTVKELKEYLIENIKDLKKSGGRYQDKTGIVRKIDLYNNKLIFKDKTKINIEDIVNINIDNLEKTYF